jgi:DNA gyrase/topoisomerase IV subunit B
LDEHTSGRCNNIQITIDTDRNIYTIVDDGQGFPINALRDDGETVLQAAFDVMNTSGKYHNESEDSCYSGSIGTNGCGAKLTNFLSLWLEVYSTDGYSWERIRFKDGIFKER